MEGPRDREAEMFPSQFHRFAGHLVPFLCCIAGVQNVAYPRKAQFSDGHGPRGVGMSQCGNDRTDMRRSAILSLMAIRKRW